VRQPVEQPAGQRAGAAAKVEHQRVRAAGPLFDRVDQGGEPVLAIGQAGFLLTVPALDPLSCGAPVKGVIMVRHVPRLPAFGVTG
jgi:hypothetical protein